jgi:hypothetical protein
MVPQKGYNTQTTPYQAITVDSETVLFPNKGEESPRMAISLVLLDPAENTLLQQLLYDNVSPEDYAARLIRDYEDFYQEIITQEKNIPDLSSAVLDWTYQERHRVHAYSQLQVISRTKEYYTGGAHGMRETAYFVIDLAEKKQICLMDLFREGTEGALKICVEDTLRVYSELKPGDPLSTGYYFEDSVEPSENFYLTPQGIGFHWDPYDIAPYSVGPVEIIIPYGDVDALLSCRGKSLISPLN